MKVNISLSVDKCSTYLSKSIQAQCEVLYFPTTNNLTSVITLQPWSLKYCNELAVVKFSLRAEHGDAWIGFDRWSLGRLDCLGDSLMRFEGFLLIAYSWRDFYNKISAASVNIPHFSLPYYLHFFLGLVFRKCILSTKLYSLLYSTCKANTPF